jgi:hypothetical protein
VASKANLHSTEINLNVVTSMKWIPETETVLQCGEDLWIRIWDVRSPDPVQKFRGGNDFAVRKVLLLRS